jgi:aspartyl/asparaginyl beta-hydroxylase (cupin superfamily)
LNVLCIILNGHPGTGPFPRFASYDQRHGLSGPINIQAFKKTMLSIEYIKNRVSNEFLWQTVKGFGTARELERVRDYIFNGFEHVRNLDPSDLQRPNWGLFPGLSKKPWHDPESLGWTGRLEDSFEDIHRELCRVTDVKAQQGHFHKEVNNEGKWNVFYLQTLGPRTAKAAKLLCPITTSLLASIPDGIGRAWFSALLPDGYIKPHFGNTNTRLRLHLGLIVPPGCSIRVDKEERPWANGEFLLLDDSYEHEVWNRSTSTRWILLMDLWHPDLTRVERMALTRLNNVRMLERKKWKQDLKADARAYSIVNDVLKRNTVRDPA